MSYQLTILANGARIATAFMPHMKSVAVGFWAGVGGRHESERLSGVSHFLEHMLFKGTKRRTARQITEDVEGIGGYINAFTTEDHTCYYAKAGANHFERLCDVLSDIYLNSQFAPTDVEREREVIREEIHMYRDQPSDHVRELLSETLWPEHPLGRPLTGTEESIGRFRRDHLTEFHQANYCGANTLVTVAGPVSHELVVKAIQPLIRHLPKGRRPRFQRARFGGGPARITLQTQETEQTHLAMGFHAFGRHDERRFALKLLSVLLGENMSSRLFQKLRERHGYCYSVHTNMVTLEEAGAISIHAGLDHSKLRPSMRMILRELEAICRKAPSKSELRKAKDYTIGQTFLGLESTTNQMVWMGESLIGYGKILDPSEIESRLYAIEPDDVQSVACHCLHRARLGVAVVGPIEDRAEIAAMLN